jgi:hypothetical protein
MTSINKDQNVMSTVQNKMENLNINADVSDIKGI